MRKVLSWLVVLCTIISMAVPAMATGVNEEDKLIISETEETVTISETNELSKAESGKNTTYNGPAQSSAEGDADTYDASYPLIYVSTTESSETIPYGEKGQLKFVIFPEYHNEWYTVEIYDSNGNMVGSADSSYYNSDGTYVRYVTITVDTLALEMTPGNYTVKYWLEYYSYGSWHYAPYYYTRTLTVVENKCNGNHTFKLDSVWDEATCEEEGTGKYKCSVCGHIVYQSMPMVDHTYDAGEVIAEPTADTTGVRAYTCTVCGDTRTESIPALETAPEKPYKIANVVSGVHVYWNAVEGAQKYGIWRSENGKNGDYKWLGNPTVPHFTDTNVESGKTYHYKITILNTELNTHTNKSESLGITYVATPDITSRFNKAAGITLGWEKIQGATGYAIYRKSYSGTDDWVRIATIEGNSTFTWQDTSVKNNNGTAYKYTIRALGGTDMKTLSGCRNAGRTMVRLTSRILNSATATGKNAIKCTWTTSSAVTGYEVRFLVDGEVYTTFTIGNYKTGVKTFTGLEAGHTYKIQVRSYKKIDGMGFYSAWSTAKEVAL